MHLTHFLLGCCKSQVYCLNTALKLYSSVVVVPVFYGTYTALGLVNTIIYLDEIGNYPGWAIALVFAGIGVLIYGVYLLSSKPDPSHPQEDVVVQQEMSELPTEPSWMSAKEEKESASTKLRTGSKDASELVGEGSGSQQRLPTLVNTPTQCTRVGWIQRSVARMRYWTRKRCVLHRPMINPFASLHSSSSTTSSPSQITPPLPAALPSVRQSDIEALRHRPMSSSPSHSSDTQIYADHPPSSPPIVDHNRVKP